MYFPLFKHSYLLYLQNPRQTDQAHSERTSRLISPIIILLSPTHNLFCSTTCKELHHQFQVQSNSIYIWLVIEYKPSPASLLSTSRFILPLSSSFFSFIAILSRSGIESRELLEISVASWVECNIAFSLLSTQELLLLFKRKHSLRKHLRIISFVFLAREYPQFPPLDWYLISFSCCKWEFYSRNCGINCFILMSSRSLLLVSIMQGKLPHYISCKYSRSQHNPSSTFNCMQLRRSMHLHWLLRYMQNTRWSCDDYPDYRR